MITQKEETKRILKNQQKFNELCDPLQERVCNGILKNLLANLKIKFSFSEQDHNLIKTNIKIVTSDDSDYIMYDIADASKDLEKFIEDNFTELKINRIQIVGSEIYLNAI